MITSSSIPQVTASFRELPREIPLNSKECQENHPRKDASGWVEREIKEIRLKTGLIASYPKVFGGVRDLDNPLHWYWKYCWWEKRERRRYIPQCEVFMVRSLISSGKSVATILIHLGKGGAV